MIQLWNWGGDYFGYRDGDELWTHDGRQVGRFYGDQIHGPDGRYVGEMNRGRLITRLSKHSPPKERIVPAPNRPPVGRLVAGRGGYGSYPGYEDFLTPDEL